MDIYEFAINFERENREYYEKCAEEVEQEGLKSVFRELAEEERKHENIVKQLKADKKVGEVVSDILPYAKTAFDKIAAKLPENPLTAEQVDVYNKALAMETKSYEYYIKKAEESELPHVQRVFNELAKEEKKHERIIENIIKLVNRPNTWLEDAEWYHLEEY